jgi:hypothetical protein
MGMFEEGYLVLERAGGSIDVTETHESKANCRDLWAIAAKGSSRKRHLELVEGVLMRCYRGVKDDGRKNYLR